jgi:hypothetical protein
MTPISADISFRRTGGGRLIGIVHSQTQAMEFFF